MRFLIVGPGAVGCILGASLIRSGQDVTFLARGESLEALKNRGLKIEWPSETWEHHNLKTLEAGSSPENFDFILFCVKGYDWQNAAKLLQPFSSRFILTFQNGVIVHREMRQQYGDSVRASVIYVSADRISPGVVRSKSNARVVLDGNSQIVQHLQSVQQALSNPFVTAVLSEDIELDLWRKYLFLSSFSAMNTLTEKPLENLLNDPYVKSLWIGYMKEITAIAQSENVQLTENDVNAAMSNAEKFPPGTTSSLFSDTQRKQKTEVELLQGHLARLAEKNQVAAPISQAIYALLRQKTAF
ncbi:MAG TPA: 2-dehydropantoate 2-reductase [Acidobacteriota bacterium]